MGGKGGVSKKAAAAARQQEAADAAASAAEDAKWEQGSKKGNSKKDDAEAKKQEALRKKAERDAELEQEESLAHASGKKAQKKNKTAAKKGSGIDGALESFQATNIDDAIDALQLANGASGDKVERHPERRFKATLKAYEDARLPELKEEHRGLRLNQYKELMYKEFQKHPDNPFNQTSVAHNASQADVQEALGKVKKSKQDRLAVK